MHLIISTTTPTSHDDDEETARLERACSDCLRPLTMSDMLFGHACPAVDTSGWPAWMAEAFALGGRAVGMEVR